MQVQFDQPADGGAKTQIHAEFFLELTVELDASTGDHAGWRGVFHPGQELVAHAPKRLATTGFAGCRHQEESSIHKRAMRPERQASGRMMSARRAAQAQAVEADAECWRVRAVQKLRYRGSCRCAPLTIQLRVTVREDDSR